MTNVVGYVPHSDTTRHHYERLLHDLRRCLPPGSDGQMEGVAEELLDIVCGGASHGVSVQQQHLQLEHLLNVKLTREQEDRLLQYGRLITDYVVTADNRSGRLEEKDNNIMPLLEEAPSSSSGGDSSSDDDDDAGVITALTGGTHKKRSKKSRKHRADQKDLAQFAFSAPDDDGGMGEDRGDNEFGEDDGDDEMMDMTFSISFDEVACNPDYVHDALRRHFPSQSSDTCTAQAGRVLQFLNVREVDALTLETQLTAFLGGYEDEGVMQWISDVAASRWCIVYGLQYALATTQKAKEQVMNDMRTHAEEDVVVERLYQNITGKEIGLVKKRNKAGENEEETEAAADDERPLRKVDLQSSSFADERTPHQHVQARVPAGTQRVAYETHDEVVLPPPPRSTREGETLVPITEFPLWATKAFAGVTQLNPMQSKVYSTAFLSDENMLVCAPTGAGKTNVAMMAMLRCIQNAMNPDGSIQLHQLKMVYVAPMKALVQEVVRTFSKRLEPLGLAVAELSGDSSMTQKQMAETQLLVTTPEKWDVITRKSVELGVASLLKLLILDEVHLLHNDRGPVLEAIVARTMLQQQLRGEEGIRIVGLSATLPNYHDVATFLQVDRQRGLHVFDASYRPIPLQQTFCAAKKIKGVTQPTVMNRVVYDKVLQAAQDNEQTMIFVHSRRDTEHTAQYMKQRVQEEHRNHFIVQPNSESERVLRAIIEDGSVVLRRSLQQLLPYGFAIHHAGLSRDERQTVEKLFEERHIRVLVCTSTLAWGVNLPANQVIIKGTRVFDGSTSQLLSALDVLQMFGRAGRVGFGASLGRAAIVTSPEDLHYYLGILSSQLPIESQMMKRLVDMMNAEITLGHIESTKEGVRWLQRTYLYVRMRASPEKYGIRPSAGDPLLLHHLENIVHTACEDLKTSSMAEYMYPQSRKVGSTPYGRIASYYYVTAASMSIYLNKLSNCMKDEDLFRLFSMSSEFSHISARADEQAQLAELLEVVPIAIRESRYSPMAKINVLLQCFISRLSLEGLPLMSELVYVKDSAQRILRALYDICMVREYCRTAQQFLELFQMVVHRQWNVESPLRQVREVVSDKVLDSLLPTLERVRVPWEEVRLWSLEDLVDKLGDERRAGVALECIQRTPHFVLDYTAVRPLTRSLLYVDVDLHGDFRYDPVAHGNTARELLLTVELPNCRLLHQETILLPLAAIGLDEGTESFSCPPLVVPMVEPRPTHLILRLTSPMWLHAQTSKAICLLNLPLPPLAPALRETHMRAATANGGASEDMDVLSVLAPYRLEASAGKLFPFTDFFAHQRELVEPILDGNHENLFAGIPPGGGKTVVAELFVLSFLLEQALEEEDGEQPSSLAKKKLLYITCHDDVATRRLMDWKFKFGELLQQKVVGLDGTALHNPRHLTELEEATIIVTTGAHLVRCLRSASASKVCQSVTHIVADHLHLLRDVEGRHVEESLARLNTAPFLVNGGTSRARLLALSYPLISPLEVCRWLRISSSMQFNFGLSYRSNQVRMVGMDAPGLRSRQEASVMAALKLLQRAPYSQQSCLVFVASRRQAEEVAKRVIVKCRDFVPETPVASVEDARLGLLLSAGVGYLHQCVSDLDVLALLEALDQPAVHPLTLAPLPLVLVCTFDAANRLPAGVTSNAIVCVPERPRGIGDSVSTDCTATEVQSMTSRAVREAVVYCRLPRRWVLGQLLNEPLPLECSMRYPEDFRSIVNAAVADGRVKNKIDVLRVLQTHYFLYHLKSHLAFYGVPPEDGIQAYASNFAFSVVHALQERKCLWIEGEADGEDDPHALLHVTPRGRAMALYDMDFDSMETVLETVAELQESGRLSSMGALWSCVCMGCVELTSRYLGEAVRLGDEAEANALRTIARALPSSFGVKYMDLDFSMEQTKVYILTLSHCARFWNGVEPFHPATRNASHPLSSPDHVTEGDAALLCAIAPTTAMKLDEDRRLILPQVMRTLEALTSILDGSHGSVGVSLLMELSQCIRRGVWSLEDHPLLQLSTLQRDLPQTLAITPSVLMKSMLQGSPSLTVDGLQTATTAPAIVRAVEKLLERHPNSNRGMTSDVVLKKLRADAAGIPCVRSIEAKGSMEELVEGGEMVVVLSVHAELANYISPTPSEEAPARSEIAENCAERWWLRCSLRPKARGSTRSEKEEKLLVVDTAVATTSVVKSEPLALISAQTRFPVSLLESEADLDSVEVVVHLHHFVFQVQAEAVASFDG